MAVQHNLTQEHCDCLSKVLQQTPPYIELAKACVDCGLPFDEFATQLQAAYDQAKKLKATLFPHQP